MATVPGNATIEEELYDAQVKYKSIITIDNIEIFVNLDEKALKYGREYDGIFLWQIMVRVKDAELQKLRSQVKNLENNLERTTEVRTMLIPFLWYL